MIDEVGDLPHKQALLLDGVLDQSDAAERYGW